MEEGQSIRTAVGAEKSSGSLPFFFFFLFFFSFGGGLIILWSQAQENWAELKNCQMWEKDFLSWERKEQMRKRY